MHLNQPLSFYISLLILQFNVLQVSVLVVCTLHSDEYPNSCLRRIKDGLEGPGPKCKSDISGQA